MSEITKKTLAKILKPQMCCIDLSENVLETLKKCGYNLFSGTLGSVVDVPNKRRSDTQLLVLDNLFPENFHEYDILILDLTNKQKKDFKPVSLEERKSSEQSLYSLACTYPANVFNPRPLSAHYLSEKIQELNSKPFIHIVFAAEKFEISYEIVEISQQYHQTHPNVSHSIYDFYPLPLSQAKYGKEVTICEARDDIRNLLKKHLDSLTYEQTFSHPESWNAEKNKYEPNSSLVPLMKNMSGEIVSFVYAHDSDLILVFPNFKDKSSFLSELINNILPSLYPEVFPFSTEFKWINSQEYFLPNQKQLQNKKEELQKEFEKNLLLVNNAIEENQKEFQFLHDILIETDSKLVHALYKFLNWLDFKSVVIKDDESKSLKEEDLQIQLEDGILVIETKGIGGTSTDSDCSQISKIKHRRCKERNAFDVFALYIVNHQRFLPPVSRKNPPFTDMQIKDAENDERGLVSTWQLFKLYNDIQKGLLTKADARNQMLQYGLVTFKPKISNKLGIPKELLKGGQVAILNITNTKIKIGDTIFFEKGNDFFKVKVVSIRLDDKDVNEVENGEIGIKLNSKIPKGAVLWTA